MSNYTEYVTPNREDRSTVKYHKSKRYPTYKDGKQTSGAYTLRRKGEEIIVFTTRTSPHSKIRNAYLGTFYNDRVGSGNESKYFKIALATGELGWDTNHLYYDCPEDYENHFHCKLSSEIKTHWRERNGLNSSLIEEDPFSDPSSDPSSETEYSDEFESYSCEEIDLSYE